MEKESWAWKNWCFWTVVLEKTLGESLGLQGDQTSQSSRKSVLNFHWKNWCWSRNSSTLATWCKELTHLKRPWCWDRLRAGGEGDDRGWDGWMASLTQWTWIWASSRSWWWTGEPGVLQSRGLKESDTTEQLNWTFGKLCLAIWRMTFHVNLLKSFKEKYIEKEPVILSRLSELACQRCSLSLHSNAYPILPWVTHVHCSCQENALLQSHLLNSVSKNSDGTGTCLLHLWVLHSL